MVGKTVVFAPTATHLSQRWQQAAYGRNQKHKACASGPHVYARANTSLVAQLQCFSLSLRR